MPKHVDETRARGVEAIRPLELHLLNPKRLAFDGGTIEVAGQSVLKLLA